MVNLHRSLVETLPNISSVQAAITVVVLLLYRKLARITASKLGRWANVDGNPEAHQGIEGDLHDEIFCDSAHVWVETSAA